MVHDCAARGRPLPGHRRPRRLILLISSLALVLALSGAPARASGGGASLGGGHGSAPVAHTTGGNPLDGRAMWIWEMGATDHGRLGAIIASAKQYGIGTLFVKAGDGGSAWSQFTPSLVSQVHAAGLRVCAWQYVYGNLPSEEAAVGARAVHDGADCLIIDAEAEYEGKYVSAQRYISALRAQIGYRYPLVLAGFPYVDDHPAFPYSVFLGPGGAQYNAPQMYWRDIGTTTDAVFAHTYSYNLIYQRQIFPLGQVYDHPPAHQIVRFRSLARAYGAPGVSWWDWQEARASAWTAVSRPAGAIADYAPDTTLATIKRGDAGDLVVWAELHLLSAGYTLGPIDGRFDAALQAAVEHFQLVRGLEPDGMIGPETWSLLLKLRAARVTWRHYGKQQRASAWRAERPSAAEGRAAASGGAPIVLPVPATASLPAVRDEIPGTLGSGGG